MHAPAPCPPDAVQVTLEAMQQLLASYRGRYTTVVGFQPTGWALGGGGGGAQRSGQALRGGKRLQRGTSVLYKVCFSWGRGGLVWGLFAWQPAPPALLRLRLQLCREVPEGSLLCAG